MIRKAWQVACALYELARFDVVHAVCGAGGIERQLRRHAVASRRSPEFEGLTFEALETAICLYVKPVRCLQRSVCAVRLLRNRGLDATLVIGYRPVPFFSHAWVEIGGRVANGSQEYKRQMQVLHTV